MTNAEVGRAGAPNPLGLTKPLAPEVLQELRETYLSGVRSDLDALDHLLEELERGERSWPDSLFRLREVVHNIKGQGSSFGFPLMTEIGESLHRLLQKSPGEATPAAMAVIGAHNACLRRVIEAGIEGDGGPKAQSLLSRLRSLTLRVTTS